jgi:hypothetical protein
MDTWFDRQRAWIEGTMPADERVRFESEIARDPELARAADEMRLVWQATAAGLGAVPASALTIDDVVASDVSEPPIPMRWRRVAAAALLIAAACAATYAARRFLLTDRVPLVKLDRIPLDAGDQVKPVVADIPAVLANWSPVENGKIHWLDSLADAREVSAVLERPIFVYGYIDGCPICAGFQANEFRDPKVQALVERSVPVAIDLLSLDEKQRNEMWNRRYPLLELQDDRGEIVRTFGGTMAEVDMQGELASALQDVKAPKWPKVRELAAAWERAQSDEEAGKLADAAKALEKLAQQKDEPAFAVQGQAGLSDIGVLARRAIEHARQRAETDPKGARTELDSVIERFAGTPFEADLRAVAAAWRSGGPFPLTARRVQ